MPGRARLEAGAWRRMTLLRQQQGKIHDKVRTCEVEIKFELSCWRKITTPLVTVRAGT